MSDFFSKEYIESSEKEIKEKENNYGGDKRQKMTAGIHDLFVNKTEMDTKDNVPIIKITTNVDKEAENFRDLTKSFYFDEKQPDKLEQNKKGLIEFFYKGFGYTFKPGDLKAIFKQIETFQGKKVRAAVRVRQTLMRKKNAANEPWGVAVFDVSEIYYVGKITEELFLKEEKKFQKLKEKEIQELEDHKAEYPERYDEDGKLIYPDADGASHSESHSEQADFTKPGTDPFEEEKPKSAAKPKAEPKPKAEIKQEPIAPPPPAAGNDLPWE